MQTERRQFSMRYLLFLILVVGLTLGLFRERWRAWNSVSGATHYQVQSVVLDLTSRLDQRVQEMRHVEAERDHLRSRIAGLTSQAESEYEKASARLGEDPSRTYVLPVPVLDKPLTWTFDVYVPTGEIGRLDAQVGSVPAGTLGQARSGRRIVEGCTLRGQQTVTISLRPREGTWDVRLKVGSQSQQVTLGYSVYHGDENELGGLICRLAIRHRDNWQLQHAAAGELIELLRLSEVQDEAGGMGKLDEVGVVVYLRSEPMGSGESP